MSAVATSLWVLLRLRVLLLLRPRVSARGGTGAGQGRLLLRVVILAAVALGLAVGLGNLMSGAISGPIGRLLLLPALTLLSSSASLLLFLLSVPVALAAFTYSSDLKLLLLTPLPPRLIMGEKFVSLLGTVALPLLTVGLIVVLLIGQAIGLGLGYDLMAILVLALLPVAPLALAVLLTVAVLRWVPPARARALTAILGALFGIAIYLGSRLLSAGAAGGGTAAFQASLSGSAHAWWSTLPTTWPGRALAAAGLGQTGTALAYLAATAVVAAALAALAIALSAHLFATGWATYQEVGRRSRVTAAGFVGVEQGAAPAVAPAPHIALAIPIGPASRVSTGDAPSAAAGAALPWDEAGTASGEGQRRRAWRPLLRKEWRVLRRDTQVWSRLIYPLFVLGFGFYQALTGQSSGSGRAAGAGVSILSVALLTYFLLVVLALPIVNREGRSLYLLALAPVSARDILLVKWAFCAAPVLLLVEAVLILGAAILHASLGEALLATCAFALLIVALAGALLLVSLIWPRLDWDNPRRQVSGTASVVGGLGGLVLVGATCALFALTLALTSGHPLAAAASGIGLFALPALVIGAVLIAAPPRLAALLTGERRMS